jgi:hypothetical protein
MTYGQLTIGQAITGCEKTIGTNRADKSEDEWQQPISLERPELPSMDSDSLPPVFSRMVEGVARATETPVELPLLLGLATLATACQKRFIIQPEQGYSEPLNLWTLTLLDPGNRKSSVQQYLAKPLMEYERERAREMEPWITEAKTKQRNWEARIQALRNQYAKAKPGNLAEIERELTELESNPVEVPRKEQIWTQDVTPERLGTIMAENNEGAAILSAEGGVFENIGGRYNGNIPNLDIFLQSHSGDPARVDRGSRECVYMENPALTMGLSAQPGIFVGLSRHKSFRLLGLWARFLFAVPISPLGYRKLETIPINQSVKDAFHNCVKTLLSISPQADEYGNSQPFILTLSPEAYQEWKSFSLGVERELADGGEFEHIRDWAGKLPGQAARIAGIFHCVENVNKQPWKHPVSVSTMRMALNLAAVLSRHALVVFDLMGASQEVNAATKIWRWIERSRLETFSKRDCYQRLKGTFPKVADLMPGLLLLTERYYIRSVKQESKGPGRKTELFEVNPSLTEVWK